MTPDDAMLDEADAHAAIDVPPRYRVTIQPDGLKFRVVRFDTVRHTYRTVSVCLVERDAWDALGAEQRRLETSGK